MTSTISLYDPNPNALVLPFTEFIVQTLQTTANKKRGGSVTPRDVTHDPGVRMRTYRDSSCPQVSNKLLPHHATQSHPSVGGST